MNDEAPQEIVCYGGVKLPCMAALLGYRPEQEAISNEDKDDNDGE